MSQSTRYVGSLKGNPLQVRVEPSTTLSLSVEAATQQLGSLSLGRGEGELRLCDPGGLVAFPRVLKLYERLIPYYCTRGRVREPRWQPRRGETNWRSPCSSALWVSTTCNGFK